MNELIKIDEQTKAVSARSLYQFLGVSKDFTDWFKYIATYGFEEGKDFSPILGKSTGGRPSVDYALTIDTAKEIAMLQRTEKGKQARQYFIEVEKQYRTHVTPAPVSRLDMMQLCLDQLRESEARIQHVEYQVTDIAARVTTIDTDYYTLAGYYTLNKRKFDLSNTQAQQMGKRLKQNSEIKGVPVKPVHSERYGVVNSYHKDILHETLLF